MPRILDTTYRVQELTAAVSRLVTRDGVEALSLRRIAAEADLSPSTVLHHLGGRERLMQLMCVRAWAGVRATSDFGGRGRGDGPLATLLPDGEEGRRAVRVWLALCELARADDALAAAVAQARTQERHWIRHLTGLDDEVALDVLHGLVDGLRVALCDRQDPCSPQRAVDALGWATIALLRQHGPVREPRRPAAPGQADYPGPGPTDRRSRDPGPGDLGPGGPGPSDLGPSDPEPSGPGPGDLGPSDPEPSGPRPSGPGPGDPEPSGQ
ncbi:TetR family transcriptional regulator C-terminal domain-containing protein [Nocardioides kribbensis]|uniref:TetR family transcriptional regulator C-terminal domain-containing protein n=1 Tax=Nocardioides kribbensis TaxID=305517 RepID=A0ABV1P2L7_9ACTN